MTMIADRVAAAEQVGLSTSRLQRVDAVGTSYIDRGVIAGAVTLVTRNGRIGHLAAHSHMDIAAGRRMETDTIFRLAFAARPGHRHPCAARPAGARGPWVSLGP